MRRIATLILLGGLTWGFSAYPAARTGESRPPAGSSKKMQPAAPVQKAAPPKPVAKQMPKEEPAEAPKKMIRLGVRAGLGLGFGSMKNASSSILPRTVNALLVQLLPGVWIGNVLLGLTTEFRMVGQLTDVASTANTNLKGSGYLLGPGAGFKIFDRWTIWGGFEIFGNYRLSLPTGSGLDSSFKAPLGIRVGVDYRFSENLPIWLGLSYHWVSYKTNVLAGENIDIGSNALKHWLLVGGISYYY